MPAVEKRRYYSVQLTDMYSFNYGYMGSLATGSDAGCYMVAGPGWKGETPAGVKKVFASETQFSLAIFRTQLFGPDDIGNVKKVQAGYQVQPLSAFLHQPAPAALPLPEFPKFTDAAFKTDFPAYLSFLLQFCPTVEEEKVLRAKFAELGIAAGKPFEFDKLSETRKVELGLGVKEGYEAIEKRRDNIGKEINGWGVGSAFGDRGFYKGDFLLRSAAALAGIYGNNAEEAMYPMAKADATGAPLDGHTHNYSLTFRRRAVPSRQRVLVRHHVRRQNPTADRKPDQPLPHQLPDAAGLEEEP